MQTEEPELPLTRPSRRARHEAKRENRGGGGVVQFLKELPVLVIVALGIALLIKTFVLQAFFIPSESMENTLLVGDRVLVSKFIYRFSEPEYGQVVVFASPQGEKIPAQDRGTIGNFFNSIAEGLGLRSSEKDFIKRVIATEGQKVEVTPEGVIVDGKKLNEPYRRDQAPIVATKPVLTVPEDHVYVMGDNRNNSSDSRVFGPIPESGIIGRAFVLIWPLNRISFFRKP